MKRKILYIILSVMLVGFTFSACSEDSLSSTSVVIDSTNEQNEFDRWLDTYFRADYNIQFKYKYEDIESDLTYDLVPADIVESKKLAKMVKYLWLEPYVEVGGLTFLRTYAPRIFHVIGTVGWNANNTYTLGTAEGGLKITLYAGNWLADWLEIDEEENKVVYLDKDNINYYYLHTLHHEFGHILHQTKDYPTEFKEISAGNYKATWDDLDDEDALELGFISAYATSEANEDFVETLAFYVTLSDEEWNARMAVAGADAEAIIMRKVDIVKKYMLETWKIDLDVLKRILERRFEEVYEIDWVNFEIV
ncbi:MAG: putative zinc-binding metallopeptidase [Bacteroides sp.]|nr:putative zinc-binding metallopeptidase [Bacteroides sp.]